MHPAKSILGYAAVIALFMLVVMLINITAFGPMHGDAYAGHEAGGLPRAAYVLPLLVVATLAALMTLRVIGFVGGNNLLHLLTGRYHRPREERVARGRQMPPVVGQPGIVARALGGAQRA